MAEIRRVVSRQPPGAQIDGDRVIGSLRVRPIARGVILDVQLTRRHHDPQISVIDIVVVFEYHLIDTARGLLHYLWYTQRRLALARQPLHIVPAVAAAHVGNLRAVGPSPSEALIIVHVARKDRVRPNPRLPAHRVHVGQHLHAPAMARTRLARRVRRVVVSKEQRALVLLRFHPRERRREKLDLRIADFFIRNDAGILQGIAVQHEDPHEGRIEGKEHPGLDLRGTRQSARLRRHRESVCAKVPVKRVQAGDVDMRRHHPVVITRRREDGCGIVPIGFIELIEIILRFAEAVDDVAQQQIELGQFFWVGFVEIAHHLVRHFVLRFRTPRTAAIPRRMEYDLAAVRDRLDGSRIAAQHLLKREGGFDAAARPRKRQRRDLVLAVQLIDLFVSGRIGRVIHAESERVRRGLRLCKHGTVELPNGSASFRSRRPFGSRGSFTGQIRPPCDSTAPTSRVSVGGVRYRL